MARTPFKLRSQGSSFKMVGSSSPLPKLETEITLPSGKKIIKTGTESVKQAQNIAARTAKVIAAQKKKFMQENPNYTAPYIPSPKRVGVEYTKEQYEQMSDERKQKYHSMMRGRYIKSGNKDLANFYQTMWQRIRYKRNLPIYFSPEDESNA